MEYTGKINIAIACFVSLFLSGCWFSADKARKNNPNTDPFYVEASGFDYSRFPLINPYAIMTINRGKEWNLGIKDDIGFSYNVTNVKKLYVKKGFILVYASDSTTINNKKVYEAWFVINPNNKEEKGFVTEQEFLNYLKKENIEKPEWREVNAVFKQFVDTYCLEWIPGCNK